MQTHCLKIITCLISFLLIKQAIPDSVSLYLENDCLEKMPDSSTSDGFYTAGESVQYENDNNYGLRLKSQIYTPSDKDSDQINNSDRPYCGLLYGEFFKKTYRSNHENRYGVGIGIVGPASGGELIQTELHQLISSSPPKGWKYQIDNEPILQISYYITRYLPISSYIEFCPYIGANLGNYLINAELGSILKAGWNIPKKFDPVIKLAKDNIYNSVCIYGFVGGIAYGVARNMSLDGNTFKENVVTVDKNNIVGDGLLGLCIAIYNFQVTATHVERTKEFTTQSRDARFDSLQITMDF